jgi:hypothetical protein
MGGGKKGEAVNGSCGEAPTHTRRGRGFKDVRKAAVKMQGARMKKRAATDYDNGHSRRVEKSGRRYKKYEKQGKSGNPETTYNSLGTGHINVPMQRHDARHRVPVIYITSHITCEK